MSAELAAPAGVRSLVLRGLGWKVVSQVTLQGSRVIVAVVLARLLTPRDYGIAGMVLVFSGLVYVFADLGLGSALVQRQDVTEDDRSTAFWLGVTVGSVLTVVGILLAAPIAAFYREPEVRPLFIALSASFLVTALGTTQAALMTRSMNFRSLELRMILATVVGAIAGIVVATRGGGAWAIIAQQLVVSCMSTALLWIVSPWRPHFRFSRASVHRVGGFGAHIFGSNLFFYLNRNVDNLLVGRFLGPAALGVYAFAYNVMLIPLSRLSRPVQDVFFPAFSRLQNRPERMALIWIRVTRMIGAITLPAMAGLVVVAPEFVSVILGERWKAAVPVIQILAWVGFVQSLSTLNGRVLAAVGQAHVLFRFSIFSFCVYLAAFGGALHFGIVAVAAAYAAVATILVQPTFTRLASRALGVSPWRVVRGLSGIVQASVVMTVAVLVIRQALLHAGLGPSARLVALVVLGATVYVPLLFWRAPEVLEELRSLRRSHDRVGGDPRGAADKARGEGA